MAKLNKKLFLNGWILLALILVVGVAGSLYSIPYIEGYKNKNDLFENQGNLKCLEEKKYTLLGDWYPVNEPNPQFSNKDQGSQYRNFPYCHLHHYILITHNIGDNLIMVDVNPQVYVVNFTKILILISKKNLICLL